MATFTAALTRIASSAFTTPVLEEYRCVAHQTIATEGTALERTYVLASLAFNTELRSFLVTLIDALPGDTGITVVERRRLLDIDALFTVLYTKQRFALAELGTLGVPSQHQDLLATHLNSPSFNHRVAAVCTIVLLAGILEAA